MKTLTLAGAVIIALAFLIFNANAQQTAPVLTDHTPENDTLATTTWDSTFIGIKGYEKTVEFDNDGAVTLYVCAGNDTAGRNSKNHSFHTVKTTEREFTARFSGDVTFVRTRAASGTCSRRIKIWRR